jgi:hypothetical protein
VLTTQLREIGQYCLLIHAAGQIFEYSETVMRVPLTQGLPLRTPGVIEM